MQLLLLTAGESCPIPSLEVLAHDLAVASIATPLHSLFAGEHSNSGTWPDVILIDGLSDPRAARTAAIALAGRTDVPRIALLRDSSLTAVTGAWQLDDFLTPEASLAEIEVRLRLAVFRAPVNLETGALGDGTGAHAEAAIKVSGVEIDDSNFIARVQGRPLDLTYKEFELLHFLAANPARVFTREQLLSDVWGSDYFGGTRTVDVHIRRLRAKLGDHEWLISTVRGVGYGFARSRREEAGAS